MSWGGICGAYGGGILRDYRMDSTGYHRITNVTPGARAVKTVKYGGTSWIAVQVKDLICAVSHHISREKPEKLDLFEICSDPCYNTVAVVSAVLGNSEIQDGSGIAASFAEFNEKAAINFLESKLKKRSAFTFDETIQIAISAFRRLFPGNIKANEIQIYIRENDHHIALPDFAIEFLLESADNNFHSDLSLPGISIVQDTKPKGSEDWRAIT